MHVELRFIALLERYASSLVEAVWAKRFRVAASLPLSGTGEANATAVSQAKLICRAERRILIRGMKQL